MKIFFPIFFFLFTSLSFADDFPELFGCFCEGGLITGKIKSSDELKIDGKKMEVFQNGEFIFAFGRKFKSQINVQYNDKSRIFDIKKKKYKIERINGLPQKKVEPAEEDIKRIIKDKKKINSSKKIGIKEKLFDDEFILPVDGRLSGVFGSQRFLNSKPRRPHFGIDIAQKEGSPILVPSSGIVKLVDSGMFFTGNTIIVDHGLGLISIFAHLKDIYVEEGQKVTIGQQIGSVGKTGRATGPHLHWGIYLKNKPVDPLSMIKSRFY